MYSPPIFNVGTVTSLFPVSFASSVRIRWKSRFSEVTLTPRILLLARPKPMAVTYARSTFVFHTKGEKPSPCLPSRTSSYSVMSDMV